MHSGARSQNSTDDFASAYKGLDVTQLERDDFEAFWEDFARRKNQSRQNVSTSNATLISHNVDESEDSFEDDSSEDFENQEDEEAAEEGVQADEAEEVELTLEQRRKKLSEKFRTARPLDQEIMRKILAFCEQRKDFSAVEDEIQTYPEFPYCTKSPFHFIEALIDGGGLDKFDLDEEGRVVTEEQTEGLSEDEIDDLIVSYALQTTDIGMELVRDREPEKRLNDLLITFADRESIYKDLLGFIKEKPCKYTDIEELFKGRDFSGLKTIGEKMHVNLQPSVFLDNMEQAGGIVWRDGGWNITGEGEKFLEKLMKQSESKG